MNTLFKEFIHSFASLRALRLKMPRTGSHQREDADLCAISRPGIHLLTSSATILGQALTAGLLAWAGVASGADVAPPASAGHRTVYDIVRQEVVLYSPFLPTGGTTQTWVWNGKWLLKTPCDQSTRRQRRNLGLR